MLSQQSFFSSAAVAPAFAVLGTSLIASIFLWTLDSPKWVTDLVMRWTGGHQAYKMVSPKTAAESEGGLPGAAGRGMWGGGGSF